MDINQENLEGAKTSFQTIFDAAYGKRESTYRQIAMHTTSMTAQTVYKGFGKIKSMTEWVGPRVVQNLSNYDFAIANKDFENTVRVERNDFEDDQLGAYSHMFEDLGQTSKEWPDTLAWPLFKAGFTTKCYDGQFFFDTDHPVLDANGDEISVSNHMGGAGTAWYLVDTSRALKPVIFQQRKAPQFVAMDDPKNSNVFMNKEFLYGVDARGNVGFGLWQLAMASKQTLNSANLNAAIAAMMEMKGDHGRLLNLKPVVLIVPPSLREAANEVVKAERLANGATNTNRNVVEIHIEPMLA